MAVIGMDIGGTSIRIGIVDESNSLSHFRRINQQEVLQGNAPENLAAFIASYIKEEAPESEIQALAAGIPATLSRDRTTVMSAPNVHGLDGVNLKAELEKHLPFPVYLEKDVSMLFYYDLSQFALAHTGVLMACYIGTGIGNVISIDGTLLAGSNGAAGELGHIPVWGHAAPCGCGNDGCVETLVGGKYLAALQRAQFPQTDIGQIFTAHASHPVLVDYVEHLAIPIATEINIIDPSVVILGGGVLSMADFPCWALEQAIRRHARKPYPEKNLQFVYSDNGGENGVIGAGIFAYARL